jgi:hypothetical protein
MSLPSPLLIAAAAAKKCCRRRHCRRRYRHHHHYPQATHDLAQSSLTVVLGMQVFVPHDGKRLRLRNTLRPNFKGELLYLWWSILLHHVCMPHIYYSS